ncbi:MAG: hypothetical protein DRQ54_09870 [Gammaproteobacteria bacterium]|nr:MAG: hypothetical protein DRQ54_09870 [Gammaproteobacteria bacterium]
MKCLTAVVVLLCGIPLAVQAQIAEPASGGERGSFLECVYECKPGAMVGGVSTFKAATSVMLTNQSPSDRVAEVFYFNGNEECIAHSSVDLSAVDLDELNICHSLDAGGITAPRAGLLEISVTDSGGSAADGVYGVVKNVLGRFRVDNPELFEGRVRGLAKYECRVVPSTVQPDVAVANKCSPAPPDVAGILIEDTDDSCACNADFSGDGLVAAADYFFLLACFNQSPPTPGCEDTDLNCDGSVDGLDVTIFDCQAASGIPADPACCP